MEMVVNFWYTLLTMLRDVAPIAAILFGFQVLVLRRPIKNPARHPGFRGRQPSCPRAARGRSRPRHPRVI